MANRNINNSPIIPYLIKNLYEQLENFYDIDEINNILNNYVPIDGDSTINGVLTATDFKIGTESVATENFVLNKISDVNQKIDDINQDINLKIDNIIGEFEDEDFPSLYDLSNELDTKLSIEDVYQHPKIDPTAIPEESNSSTFIKEIQLNTEGHVIDYKIGRVIDNLTSNDSTNPLSAKQGKELKSLIDGKSDEGHNHDDRYVKLTDDQNINGVKSFVDGIITNGLTTPYINIADETRNISIEIDTGVNNDLLINSDRTKFLGHVDVSDGKTLSTSIVKIKNSTNENTYIGYVNENGELLINANSVVFTGDINIKGTINSYDTEIINVEDSFLVLNSGLSSDEEHGPINAGIQINRGIREPVKIEWNEYELSGTGEIKGYWKISDRLRIQTSSARAYIDFFHENNSPIIAETFEYSNNGTDKSIIYFNAGDSSFEQGYIVHETSDVEPTEGVLHLAPSSKNAYGDYVSIHGINQTSSIKLHTDGTIETVGSININDKIILDKSGSIQTTGNLNITEGFVDKININGPGNNKGIFWENGNGWKIFESTDLLESNKSGNFHIVKENTRILSAKTDGTVEVPNTLQTAKVKVSNNSGIGKFDIVFNDTTNTLDFNFIG